MNSFPETSTQPVAVLGLGAMGLPIAARLAGVFPVNGYDLSEDRLRLAQDAGVRPGGSARDAAAGASAVLLAVRNAEQLFLLGQAHGLGAADDSAVIRVLAPQRRVPPGPGRDGDG